MEKLYSAGPAAFGSISRLQKQSGISKAKVEEFLQNVNAHTKYKPVRRKFPRLKTIVYRINEIWSIDLADVSKLSKYNAGVRFLLVNVDCLSRYVMVEPLENKFATTTAKAFTKMLKRKIPEKVWVDKGGEFKGAFKELCDRKGIEIYTTHSETKSAYAERNIRSLKQLIYRYLEKKWTWSYISQLQNFVKTINTRVNRVTGLAPYKVTKRHEDHLVSLWANTRLHKSPKFKIGDFVRIAKQDLPFRKGYKQSFTDEIFQIVGIPTNNPPTYTLQDASDEVLGGKFYEPEITKVRNG